MKQIFSKWKVDRLLKVPKRTLSTRPALSTDPKEGPWVWFKEPKLVCNWVLLGRFGHTNNQSGLERIKSAQVILWMDKIKHRIETVGKHGLLVFTGEPSLQGFLGGAGFVHPQYLGPPVDRLE